MRHLFARMAILVPAIVVASCYLPQPLHRAALDGDLNAVKTLLDKGADVNAWDSGTALMWASKNGHTSVARLLIDRGAKLDEGNVAGDTPLGLAAQFGHIDIVRILIEKGADVERARVGLEKRAAEFAKDPDFAEEAARCENAIKLLDRLSPAAPAQENPAPAPPAACAKDTECKGNRICVDGACREP